MKTVRRVLCTVLCMLILVSSVSSFSMAEPDGDSLESRSSELIDSSAKFTDVNATSWYKEYVDYVATHELMNGMTKDTFGPGLNLTRAMFVQILANFSGVNTNERNVSTPFTDVPSGRWYSAAVKWAAENDIVNGTSPKEFSPDDNIQRQQTCVMLVRFAEQKGIEIKKVKETKYFKDDNRIQNYAKEAVDICKTAGIVDGMSEDLFAPRDSATRAQIAAIIFRFCDNTGFFDSPDTPDTPDNPDDPEVPDNPDEPEVPDNPDEPDTPDVEYDKYNFAKNPLMHPDGQQNKSVSPAFDVDSTDFIRAGTKLSDLRMKTLAFFTSDNYCTWSYRDAKGATIDEWEWFSQLKKEYAITIKFTKSQHQKSVESALQAMNAGKQCDIIYSNNVVYPSSLCITRSFDDLVYLDNLKSSPGVCNNAMELTKWNRGYRAIAPIGDVDVLWYNETLTQELGLSDPHTMWENGTWNWQSFSDYMSSVPDENNNGDKLTALVQWSANASFTWPSTNGSPYIYIDTDADKPALINNWLKPETLEAWEFITGVCNSVNYDSSPEPSPGNQKAHLGLYNGTTIMSATMYTQVYRDTEYSKTIQINWVPYPKSMNEGGRDICQWNGHAMMLPKKTAKPDNVNIALKFMELWATRFTESIFDNLGIFEYYNFDYKQRKQYFDFITNNMVFAVPMNNFSGSNLGTDTNFFKCFTGDAAYDIRTEAAKGADIVQNYIIESLKFGQ